MAYANLIAVSCNNPIETFVRFRDFMCKRNGTYDYSTTGIGWTLHDAVYAVNENTISINDYFVMYSPGEDGQRDLYFKVLYKSGYIDIIGYLYWNNTTHAGVQSYGTINNWQNTLSTNNVMWVYGDLDNFIGIAKYATNYNAGFGGWMPDSPISQAVTVAPDAITAGSSVAVTFTAVPGEWAVGTKLFVRDTANIERVVIAEIAGDIVTFTAFVASYAAGSKFALENTNYVVNSANAAGSIALQIDHAGTKNSAVNPDNSMVTGPASGDSLSGKYTAKRIFYSTTATWIGPIKNQLSTISSFTSESTHTGGATNYRFFFLYSGRNVLIEEV
jgi:hypothetical protein